ncbi:MAG: YraN family protein [Acidobacteriota bacterium]
MMRSEALSVAERRRSYRPARPPPRPGAARTCLGRAGEEAAAAHLAALGFRILARRFRTHAGEIDLVAEEGGTLVFVEVKSRSSLACGRPAEAVDRRKRDRLLRAAGIYLASVGRSRPRSCRFDVVEVIAPGDAPVGITLIRDAFQAS